jgi:hypothetical protein
VYWTERTGIDLIGNLARPGRRIVTTSTGPYGVDAAFMSFHVHGRGIHIV